MLQNFQEPGLGPVQIVDHEQHRPLCGEQFEEQPHRPRHVLGHGRLAVEPGEREQPIDDVGGIGAVAQRCGERRLGCISRFLAGQAHGTEHGLAQRPVGGTLTVGQAASRQHQCVRDSRGELLGQPGLPDACGAEDGDELTGTFAARPPEGILEQPQLRVAADKQIRGPLLRSPR